MCRFCNEANAMFETIANDLSVGVWKASDDGTVFFENDTLQSFAKKSLIGKHISSFIPDMIQREIFEELIRLNKRDFQLEISLNEDTPSEKWYKLVVHKFDNIYTGVITDITKNKKLLDKLLNFKESLHCT